MKLILKNCIWNPFSLRQLTIWCRIMVVSITSPYFFKDETGSAITMTSAWYVHMVNDFLFPQLCHHDIDFTTIWSQQIERQNISLPSDTHHSEYVQTINNFPLWLYRLASLFTWSAGLQCLSWGYLKNEYLWKKQWHLNSHATSHNGKNYE